MSQTFNVLSYEPLTTFSSSTWIKMHTNLSDDNSYKIEVLIALPVALEFYESSLQTSPQE